MSSSAPVHLPSFAALGNGRSIDRQAVPALDFPAFSLAVSAAVGAGLRVSSLFATPAAFPEDPSPGIDLLAVLADDSSGSLHVARSRLAEESFPALTPQCPQVHLFEREIAEQWGLRPLGHPWLKPVRFHDNYRGAADVFGRKRGDKPAVGVTEFYRVEGEQVHEVAVGPVHAGVIEPGHFRFQCHGEEVFHLEISLGYQHRGIEQALVGGPTPRTIHYMETAAGDTSIGHAMAHCQLLEALADCQKPARAQSLRGIALELERMANHVGDLGALAGDVGFLPTMSYCGRLRGDFLNMTALLCGSRFGRSMVRPGGVMFDLEPQHIEQLLQRLDAAERDVKVAVELLWDTPSVMARFEDIGPVPLDVARDLGMVGPAARACGLERDIRDDHPSGIFRFAHIPTSTWNTGDVFARAYVRYLEVQRSIIFIREQLQNLPASSVRVTMGPLAPNRLAVSLIEGWRGEICHVALTDEQGRFLRYKMVDPSFHNWAGLAYALRNGQISDFPLCNKSFNLSYCGHDL